MRSRKSCILRQPLPLPLRLPLLLLCALWWFSETTLVFNTTFTASAQLHIAGNSSFSTDQPSAFWLSQNAECTFGFYKTTSNAYLLSVWFTKDPAQMPLWWPILQNGLPNPVVREGAVFLFTAEGSLELWADNGRGRKTVVWSEVVSIGKGGFAEVRDTCNLVVLDQGKQLLWQSFADPRNSLMLPSYGNGSVEDEAIALDKPVLLQSKHSLHSFAAGRFRVSSDYLRNLYLHAALDQQYYQYSPGIQPKAEFIYMYASMNVVGNFGIHEDNGKAFCSNGSMAAVNRLTLSENGNLKIYSWESSAWREIWQMIDDKCKLASPCGPFAICKENMDMFASEPSVNCTCPPSLNPKLAMESPSNSSMEATIKVFIKDTKQGLCGGGIVGLTSECTSTGGKMNSANFSMVEVSDSDYYYNDLRAYIPDKNLEECKSLCLQDCRCMAASHNSNDKHCTLKGNMQTGLLMNGYAANGTTLLVKVKVSLPQNTTSSRGSSKKFTATEKGVVILCVGIVAVMLTATLACLWLFPKRRCVVWHGSFIDTDLDIHDGDYARPRRFTYKELVEATNKFSTLLGEGGFGKVYKGWINAKMDGLINDSQGTLSDHQAVSGDCITQEEQEKEQRILMKEAGDLPQLAVAVKVLKGFGFDESDNDTANRRCIEEGEKQFKAEVYTLCKVHHINLVHLLGYCATRQHSRAGGRKRILVFEYMQNGSLDKYLNMPAILQEDYLPWPTRYSIALDTARGIAYLHHDCNPPILHCDIKPQNVLLDQNFSAKVADFGFACPLRQRQNHLTVTSLRGTRGYMAPEWLTSEEVTLKADVYSYGMLLLELIHASELVDNIGGLIVDRSVLLQWALQTINGGKTNALNSESNPQVGAPLHSTSGIQLVAPTEDHLIIDLHACVAAVPGSLVTKGTATSKGAMYTTEDMSLDVTNEDHKDVNVDIEIYDTRVSNEGLEKLRLIKIGLWCVQFLPSMRPSMASVVQLLQGTIAVGEPPNPAPRMPVPGLHFCLHKSTSSACP